MTPHSRAWEKRLRRRIRAEVRSVPVLWKEYKRRRSERRRAFFNNIGVPLLFWPAILAGLSFRLFASLDDAATLVLTLLAGTVTCWRGNGLNDELRDENMERLLAHYPITRAAAFQKLIANWLLRGLWFGVPLAGLFAGVQFLNCHSERAWRSAVVVFFLQWIVLHLTAVCLARAQRPRILRHTGWVLLLLALLTSFRPVWFTPSLSVIAEGAKTLLPAAWIVALADGEWLWLIPVTALGAFSVVFVHQFRTSFIREPDADVHRPPLDEDEELGLVAPTQPVAAFAERLDIEHRIRTGQLLCAAAPDQLPLLERLLNRWLSSHELDLLRVYCGDGSLKLGRRCLVVAMITVIGMLISSVFSTATASWVLPVTVFISLLVMTSTAAARPFALYPLNFWEIIRLDLKLTLFALALWLPAPLVGGMFLAVKWNVPPLIGLLYGVKAAALVLALVPVGMLMGITSDTNDSRSRHCSTRFALSALLTVVMTVAGGAVFLFAPMPGALIGLGIANLFPWWFLWRYGSWFNRMKFDLMPKIG
jgi:hypothetical protein